MIAAGCVPPGDGAEVGGERIPAVQWQGDPARYIADALGLGYVPPTEVSASRWLANVLLGDIDVRGTRGRQGTNLPLASALTGPPAGSPALRPSAA